MISYQISYVWFNQIFKICVRNGYLYFNIQWYRLSKVQFSYWVKMCPEISENFCDRVFIMANSWKRQEKKLLKKTVSAKATKITMYNANLKDLRADAKSPHILSIIIQLSDLWWQYQSDLPKIRELLNRGRKICLTKSLTSITLFSVVLILVYNCKKQKW